MERLSDDVLQAVLDAHKIFVSIDINTSKVDKYTVSLLEELKMYRGIGTVEECREAREKQKPKKILPLTNGLLFDDGWRHKCPNCGCAVGENIYHPDVTKDYEYCSMCGQAIHE